MSVKLWRPAFGSWEPTRRADGLKQIIPAELGGAAAANSLLIAVFGRKWGPTRISSCDAVLDFYLRRVSAAFVAVSLIRCCPIVSCRL